MIKSLQYRWLIAIIAIIGFSIMSCDGNAENTEKKTYWTITWHLDGGTKANNSLYPDKVEDGKTIDRPNPNPTKEGYSYVGWFTDSELTDSFKFGTAGTPVKADLNLYVKWNSLSMYLLFVSDPHYYMKDSPFQPPYNILEHTNGYTHDSIFDSWMEQLKTRHRIPHIDYFAALGDYGSTDTGRDSSGNQTSSSEAQNLPNFWNNSTGIFIDIVDKYVDNGFIRNAPLFLPGNHEWGTANNGNGSLSSHLTAASPYYKYTSRITTTVTEYLKTDDFTFITNGAVGSNQEFTTARMNELDALFAAAPTDRPVFVLSHHPVHFGPPSPMYPPTLPDYPNGHQFYPTGRATTNGAQMLAVYNKYPNLVVLWDHNHSLVDPHYDQTYRPGDSIQTSSAESSATALNFTYLSPGAMVDYGYRPNGADIISKGMVVKILNDKYTFMFFGWNKETNESSILSDRTVTFTKAELIGSQ